MNTILNDQCGSPWIYTLQPVGRGIFVVGHPVEIRAWDLRHAIKLARARISRAWSLRLVSVKRMDAESGRAVLVEVEVTR